MSNFEIMCLICIAIELYHLMFYNSIMEKVNCIEKISTITKKRNKMVNSVNDFIDLYINNEELKTIIPLGNQEQMNNAKKLMITIGSINLPAYYLNKCPRKYVLGYLFNAFIEIIYWILLVSITVSFSLQKALIIFGLFIFLSFCNSRLKDKSIHKAWCIFDSIICISVLLCMIYGII